MNNHSPIFNRIRRRGSGFSLVTVTLFGLIATMWLTATLTSVVPAIQTASQNRTADSARAAAESAADWAVDSLNAAMLDSSLYPSPLDATVTAPTTTSVPAGVLNNSLATASVTVRNTPPPTTSYIYDQALALGIGSGSYSTMTSNGWRVIEAKATIGGVTRQVRTIVKPGYKPSTSVHNPGTAYSLYGSTSVNVLQNVQTDGYNSQTGSHFTAVENKSAGLGGDVGSLNSVNLGANVTIGGSVDVTLQPAGSSTNVAIGSDSTTVNRYMNLNGTQNGFSDNTQSEPNVLGYSNTSQGFSNDLAAGARPDSILERQGTNQPALPPAPAAPSMFTDTATTTQAVSLGALTIGTSSPTTIVVTSSAPQPPYSITQGTTNYIQPGNYTASSVNIGSNGQIVVSSGLSQPFRLFVDGTAPGTSAINISGSNGIRNSGVPSNVQIYYNGSKSVNLQSTRSLSAVVYAPNATLNMGPLSYSRRPNFYGSFVGNVVNVQNASVHFDSQLKNGSYLDALAKGNSYGLSTPKSQPQFVYKTVSWQEF